MPPRPEDELETLFRQLRQQDSHPAVATVAAHLPTRVAATLRAQQAEAGQSRFVSSLAWFGPITAAFAIWAIVDLVQLSRQAATSLEIAAWMAALFA